MTGEVVDPVTGWVTSQRPQPGKPFVRVPRRVPSPAGPCAFCAETASLAAPVFVRENRWQPFAAPSRADLVISARHVIGAEDLTSVEHLALVEALADLDAQHARDFAFTRCFCNVGVGAASSQPHLHAQVVSHAISSPNRLHVDTTRATLERDYAAAAARGLVLEGSATTRVYVAPAPLRTGEIRVQAASLETLSDALRDVLVRLARTVGSLDYNLFFHFRGSRPFAQVLAVVDQAPGVYPLLDGLCVVSVPPEEWAERLRSTSVAR